METLSLPENIVLPYPNPFDELSNDGADVKVGDYEIDIRFGLGQFVAYRNDDEVFFDISTRNIHRVRTPFFTKHRATDLARQAIEYFDRKRPLTSIGFSWANPLIRDSAENYLIYLQKRNELIATMSEDEAKIEAIKATWTYARVAAPNRFTKIIKPVEERNTRFPTFVKGSIFR